MSDVYQSQSPLVTDPTVLTEDATKATSNEDLLRILNNQTTKRRGRPPGSRNKPKMDESGQLVGGPMPRHEIRLKLLAQL